MERKTRLELATPTLARWCSTTELLPHEQGILYHFDVVLSTSFLRYFFFPACRVRLVTWHLDIITNFQLYVNTFSEKSAEKFKISPLPSHNPQAGLFPGRTFTEVTTQHIGNFQILRTCPISSFLMNKTLWPRSRIGSQDLY